MNLLFEFMLRSKRKVKNVPRLSEPAVSNPLNGCSVDSTKANRPARRAGVPAASPRAAQYAALVDELTREYDIRIKRWRKGMSGVAWILRHRNGTTSRWIESPYPAGPVSCAIFLHEVGHHAIGLGVHKPRCLEEHLAWQWALRTMEARGLTISVGVKRRVERSMRYAVSKAVRRGIKRLPAELLQYHTGP